MKYEFLKDLDTTIISAMEKMNVPGAQVAIIKDGEVIYKEAFGYADLENKVEMTLEHLLPIGSVTKSFTATAAVKLVSEGKLKLDTPLKNYLPEFELSDPVATVQATPRDLMCHRTGIPRHDAMWVNWNNVEREDIVLNRIKYLKTSLPLRSNFQYSNHMYVVIGYLIERISKLTWESYVEEKLLSPLSINKYSFSIPYPYETKEYAKLYTPNEKGENVENIPLKVDAMGPAGALNMSAGELIKWVAFQLNGGKSSEKEMISEEFLGEVFKPNVHVQALNIPYRFPLGYGLGWFSELFRGNKVIEHGGNVAGGSALVSFMPESKIGVAVLINADGNPFTSAVTKEIYDRYLEIKTKHDWFDEYQKAINELREKMSSETKAIYDSRIQGKTYSHEIEEYVGAYTNPGYGEIELTVKDKELHMNYHDNKLVVRHLHYDIFTTELYDMVFPISFTTGFNGKVNSLSIPFEETVDPIIFTKVND